MGWWPFGRRETEDKSVEVLLAEANAASPTRGSESFRLPVEDVFMITGRGCVVTGRVESGVVAVGMQVHVARDGQVVATTRVNGVEKFRSTIDTATVGENIGLLLDGLTRNGVQRGDVVQG